MPKEFKKFLAKRYKTDIVYSVNSKNYFTI